MLERIHDKVCMLADMCFVNKLLSPLSPRPLQIPVVRVHAVKALELLQDAESTVQEELVKLLEGDPSPEVRKAVLSVIAITDDTLPGEHMEHVAQRVSCHSVSFHYSCQPL